ncbi:hypothetical protein SS1G_04216 [Sclerotinia sclerotiorum 1980 UF-70]|uniref:Integral membrane protein n=1 Tax=Sclerotinia sclerotiorum (strain ATCC 18683 / 1980 / Ss-1) TaxID=665079 RepID=A7EFX5_SCLS1|nr:hypothetical protein SS1G_04216 [Sclerotinia sclerotiorum 1980 UF-70]EDO01741.1 hypothetical protein SS1G_04216 [Sclerotinia sclerotiorum 1980 UF-70]
MHSLVVESAIWYSFVIIIVVLRYISRWVQLGSIKNYQLQDYLMFAVFLFYTTLVVSTNIVYDFDTNLILPSDIPKLTPDSIASRIKGSKLVLVVEQSMIMTIWGGKACLLCMYLKMMYAALGTATHHLIVNATFNISSDLMMLFIPMPLVIKAQLPTLKEASTVMIITNMPMCWPLARKLFGLRSWSGSIERTKSKSKTSPKKYLSTILTGSKFGNKKENSAYRSESREGIFDVNAGVSGRSIGLEIWESREVSVRNEEPNSKQGRINNTTTVTVSRSMDSLSEHSKSNMGSESREYIGHAV